MKNTGDYKISNKKQKYDILILTLARPRKGSGCKHGCEIAGVEIVKHRRGRLRKVKNPDNLGEFLKR